jgi:hypothetical protein
MPGIFLIVVGILNGLVAGYLLIGGIQGLRLTDQQIHDAVQDQWDKMPDDRKKTFQDSGFTQEVMERWMKTAIPLTVVWGGVGLVVAIVGVLGGSRMIALRSPGLARTAAILTAIPFVSLMGCCLIGEVVGIWALVVLLNSDVQAAFRANAAPPDEGMTR